MLISLILAAGMGARMRPLTDHCHKTLLEVTGQPLIDRIIDDLIALDIHTHLVVTGHEAEQLTAHLQTKYPGERWIFVHNPRYAETNNIMSLALAFEHVPEGAGIVLIECDLVCSPGLLRRLVESPWDNVALVDRYRTGMDGTVVTLADCVVTSVIPPHLQGADFDFSDKYKTLNLYKFSAEFCRDTFRGLLQWYARTMDGNIYYELILGILIYLRRARINAEVVTGTPWAEVDDPSDLRVAEFTFDPARRRAILEESLGGYWSLDVLDFCFLRNMHWPTPAMYSEMRRNLPALLQNYGSSQRILDRKLAWWLQCREGRATLLSGLSQVFPLLGHIQPGARALVPKPTFGEYQRVFPGAATYVDAFNLNLDAIEASMLQEDASLVVLVTPNNPTGSVLPAAAIHDLAARYPERTFVVDESFQGFSDEPSLVTLLEAEPLDNILVLVSLSKTLGVPGVRLGYVYTCHIAWTEWLRRQLPIWNINSVAEHLLEIALKHRGAWIESLAHSRRDRADFAQLLIPLPQVETLVEGGANFITLALLPEYLPPEGLVDYLLRRHALYLKDISDKIADGRIWLRIAVRTPNENRRLAEILAALPPVA